ncbi:hypothetical protein GCM10009579_66240 [Streptomyces javensis]|uniref:Uncharacterized protein n=1 Tax=Streptomyces javensis TaxID=114698 RepID=A0ABP4HVZ6_9ACTN
MSFREDGHAVLDVEGLGGESGEVVEGGVKQGRVGASVVELVGPVGGAAEEDVDLPGTGVLGVGGEDSGEQVRVPAGFDDEPEWFVAGGALCVLDGDRHRVQRMPAVFEQSGAGGCQCDAAARAVEQLHPEP